MNANPMIIAMMIVIISMTMLVLVMLAMVIVITRKLPYGNDNKYNSIVFVRDVCVAIAKDLMLSI